MRTLDPPSSGRELVRVEITGHTAVLTLDRPEARNAINPEMSSAIEAAIDRAESADDVWAVVLASSAEVFCAGADLKTVASGSFAGIETVRGGFAGLVKRKRTKPLIVAVEGAALAGGCEIALAADLLVASANARFGLPEVKRSLVAGAGGVMRLPRVLPRNIAMKMVLTGDPITAAEAAAHGMVADLTPPGEALPRALLLAARMNDAAPLAVRASRQALLDCLEASEEEGWRISWQAANSLFDTEDFREGPRAFVEKRVPQWKAC
ncbi:enoyl-CoA hydratase-related protein [Pseudonocardia sp. RS010]|uniref:enoyl-CoA hydratase-related protein n=1 Tax=Pseudonocardia sp. RS010 TaxID=3385979 RepID=UPI0039A2ED72